MIKSPIPFIRAGIFGLAIICFFLPFVLVSCPGSDSQQVSGIQLVTGRTIKGSQLSPFSNDEYVPPSVTALVALLCAAAGIVCSFLKPKIAFALCLAASVIGIICMAFIRPDINAMAARYDQHNLRVSYMYGFWMTLVAFSAALVFNLIFNPFTKLAFPKIKRRSKGTKRRRR